MTSSSSQRDGGSCTRCTPFRFLHRRHPQCVIPLQRSPAIASAQRHIAASAQMPSPRHRTPVAPIQTDRRPAAAPKPVRSHLSTGTGRRPPAFSIGQKHLSRVRASTPTPHSAAVTETDVNAAARTRPAPRHRPDRSFPCRMRAYVERSPSRSVNHLPQLLHSPVILQTEHSPDHCRSHISRSSSDADSVCTAGSVRTCTTYPHVERNVKR